MSGPATWDTLQELLRLFVDRLLLHVKSPAPSAALLAVVRSFLRDQRIGPTDLDEKTRKKLHRMHRLLIERLVAQLETGEVNAALLAVSLDFLRDNGIRKDLGGAAERAQALQALTNSDLPFTSH